MSPRIDAHAHFFYPGFVSNLPESCRRRSPDEITLYQAYARQHEIEQVLAIGYEGDPWAAGNNSYLATLAAQNEWVRPLAFVVNPALLSVSQLVKWQKEQFVGISLYLFSPESSIALRQITDDVWQWLSDHAWLISVNSSGNLWSDWTSILSSFPKLRLLIAHLGLPEAVREEPTREVARERLEAVLQLAAHHNTYVKFSGFYALAEPSYLYPHRDAWPYARAIKDAFGPERILWASDFSPALESVSFAQTVEVVNAMTWLTSEEKAAIYYHNLTKLLSDVDERVLRP